MSVPHAFADSLAARASALRRRIVFSEAADPRVRDAVLRLRSSGIVHPVLVVRASERMAWDALDRAGVEIHLAGEGGIAKELSELLMDRRHAKGMTSSEADRLASEPVFAAADLVRRGVVDGSVAGASLSTADVMRAALWIVGPRPGTRTVSSAFYMAVASFRDRADEVLTFSDCAVVPEPTADQLVDIALAAAHDRRRVVGDAPVVAMLSFSTRGSADGPSVRRVRDATDELRRRAPDLAVDGELQVDAALIEAIGARKAPGSTVAGRANVLIFPSLDAGNIAYKLVERLAGARAVGPIVQGLAKPCCDLSRGASIDDIMSVAAVTALQAGHTADTTQESA